LSSENINKEDNKSSFGNNVNPKKFDKRIAIVTGSDSV